MQKTVLITGASTGLGLSTTKLFLENEWRVLAHYYQSTADFEALMKAQSDDKMIGIYSDFSNPASLTAFLANTTQYEIDALVNNAGIHDASFHAEQRLDEIEKVFRINTITPILLAEKVMEGMKKRKSGRIVNISSIGVKYGSSMNSCFYAASKSAVETATKSLAREGAPFNILVNAIRPGVIDTDFFRSLKKDINARVNMIPLKRFADPAEVADMVFYLCEKNNYMTSEVVTISGGE